MGVTIIGVSFDDPSENLAWAEEEGFQFELWTDTDRTLALTYGAATTAAQSIASRKTVILDASGNWVLEYPVVNVGTSPSEVLEDCQKLFGN